MNACSGFGASLNTTTRRSWGSLETGTFYIKVESPEVTEPDWTIKNQARFQVLTQSCMSLKMGATVGLISKTETLTGSRLRRRRLTRRECWMIYAGTRGNNDFHAYESSTPLLAVNVHLFVVMKPLIGKL